MREGLLWYRHYESVKRRGCYHGFSRKAWTFGPSRLTYLGSLSILSSDMAEASRSGYDLWRSLNGLWHYKHNNRGQSGLGRRQREDGDGPPSTDTFLFSCYPYHKGLLQMISLSTLPREGGRRSITRRKCQGGVESLCFSAREEVTVWGWVRS